MILWQSLVLCLHWILSTGSLVLALPQLSSPLGPVVNLGYAAFAGNTTSPTGEVDGPVTFFGGIPYAQPPLGDLRFRAPASLNETVANSRNPPITDARNWGPPCIQQPAQVGIGSEDCLLLNIWKPSDAKEGDKLPVIVYIHGGGFYYGTPQGFPLYDWVNQSNPRIVGVSIAYRLNLLGFLASDSVKEDGDLNAGLLDQRAALEWIQRHIASFGGDPDEITIDGQSAGGGSVLAQMVAFGGSKPAPFKRGVGQSIGLAQPAIPTAEDAEAVFRNVTKVIGCPASGPQTMPCLRNASVGAISAGINSVFNGSMLPVVDGPGGFLPDLPTHLIASGNFTPIEFLGGHTTNDGRVLLPPPYEFVTDADVERILFRNWPHLTNDTIQKALALYPSPGTPGSPYATEYDRAGTINQDIMRGCLDWFVATELQKKGVQNIFTYRFNSPNPVILAQTPWQGVTHTSDLFYLFEGTTSAANAGFTFTPFNSTEEALSKESIAFWTSFVSSGNPSTSQEQISPAWAPFSSGLRMVLNQPSNSSLSSASAMEVTPPSEIERCIFWMSPNVTAQTRL